MANDGGAGGFNDPIKAASDVLRGAGAKAAENSSAISLAVLDHAEQNSREAFAALRAAAGSSSVTDLMKVQGDFVREQSNRSVEQARQIGEMITRFGREMMKPPGSKAE